MKPEEFMEQFHRLEVKYEKDLDYIFIVDYMGVYIEESLEDFTKIIDHIIKTFVPTRARPFPLQIDFTFSSDIVKRKKKSVPYKPYVRPPGLSEQQSKAAREVLDYLRALKRGGGEVEREKLKRFCVGL